MTTTTGGSFQNSGIRVISENDYNELAQTPGSMDANLLYVLASRIYRNKTELVTEICKGNTKTWSAHTKIVLDPDGGTITGSNVLELMPATPYGDSLPTPTATGLTFLGWYTQDGSKVSSLDTVPLDTTSLTARYVPNDPFSTPIISSPIIGEWSYDRGTGIYTYKGTIKINGTPTVTINLSATFDGVNGITRQLPEVIDNSSDHPKAPWYSDGNYKFCFVMNGMYLRYSEEQGDLTSISYSKNTVFLIYEDLAYEETATVTIKLGKCDDPDPVGYTYNIDWGDGTDDNYEVTSATTALGSKSHTYSAGVVKSPIITVSGAKPLTYISCGSSSALSDTRRLKEVFNYSCTGFENYGFGNQILLERFHSSAATTQSTDLFNKGVGIRVVKFNELTSVTSNFMPGTNCQVAYLPKVTSVGNYAAFGNAIERTTYTDVYFGVATSAISSLTGYTNWKTNKYPFVIGHTRLHGNDGKYILMGKESVILDEES